MKDIGFKLQFILSLVLVTLLMVGIFVKGLDIYTFGVMSLLLFNLGYNNYKIYKRKYMTPIYVFFGIIVLVKVVMMLHG